MTNALYRLCAELCDDIERLAPHMRPPLRAPVDMTASTLSVKGERLRASMERYARDDQRSETCIDDDAATILQMVRDWRDRARPVGDAETLASLVLERGELFIRLFRRREAPDRHPIVTRTL